MTRFNPRRAVTCLLALLPLVAAQACVDAPAAPKDYLGSSRLVLAPYLAVVDQTGPTMAPAQANALADVFDLVDHFRMQVYRQSTGEEVVNTVIQVTPGQDSYDLSAEVTASSNEVFLVVLTALQGDVELFHSAPIPVVAAPSGTAGSPAQPTSIPLTYSGPGSKASSVEVDPGQAVVGTGGTVQLGAKVLDADGGVIAGAPVSWSSAGAGIATVSDAGVVSGVGEGITRILATTPTGLSASASVYVVDGNLAYVMNGDVMVRAAAGGEAAQRSSGGSASGLAWGSDGSLIYSEAGQVTREGAALFPGSWPSMSPDGTKIAAENGGQIWFANLDGSNPTAGPAGATPVWVADRTLVVGGGSIEQVGVDGTGRTTLVPGAVGYPAVGPGGKVAYVDNGSLRIVGGGIVATGVSGRPSWSADGMFLAVAGGGGILLAPADGSAPPVSLPGLDGASDPAFEAPPAGSSPAMPSLTGLDPDPPTPGQPVALTGGGFDDIIPKNNHVFWPTPGGSTETVVTKVTQSSITTVVPPSVVAGDIRVVTGAGTATLAFVPKLGNIEVQARTPSGRAVAGVGVVVHGPDGSVVGTGTTDADGNALFDGLTPGAYHVDLTAPAGFDLTGASGVDVTVGTETAVVPVELMPQVKTATADPADATVEVGGTTAINVSAFDVNGDPVTSFSNAVWGQYTGDLQATGTDLSGTLTGVYPSAATGGAKYWVTLNNVLFTFSATVTSYIEGTVAVSGAAGSTPAANVTVTVTDGSGHTLGTATTDDSGHYRVGGLLAGLYTVTVAPPDGLNPVPGAANVALGQTNPTGSADFLLSTSNPGATRRPGVVAIYKDYDAWGTGREEQVLNSFGLTKGVDYVVRPTSDLVAGIPAGTSLIILTSLSGGSSPLANVNSPAAQANLDAWVKGGGWLVAHLADNIYGDGYMIPGLSGKADDQLNCNGLVVTGGDHPFIRGPDGVLGTSDDLNAANVARVGGCYDNHGSLAGILPADATILMTEAPPYSRPVYATYGYGSGVVVVSTITLEWSGSNPHIITNHLWWTVMGGSPPLAAPVANILAAPRPATAAPQGATTSDVPSGGQPAAVAGQPRGAATAGVVKPSRAGGGL